MKPIPLIALFLALLLALPATAGAIPDILSDAETPAKVSFVPDQVIVKFSAKASSSDKANIKRFYGLKKKAGFNIGAELLTTGDLPTEAYVKMLNNLKHVEYAELDYIIDRPANIPAALSVVSDPYLPDLWGMAKIDAPEAWTLDQGDERVIVAIIDTGVQIGHPDLDNNIWINQIEANGQTGVDDDGNGFVDDVNGWDFYYDDESVYDGTVDNHGTHVAGTIAAEPNSIGVVGVAPNSTIMPLKFLGPDGGSTSDAILAIEYAGAHGAKIINASWGGGSKSHTLKQTIDNFDGIFVAAAGNDGWNNDIYPHWPSSYTSDNLVSVASFDPNNKKSGFSNYGVESVDLFAPGNKIWSTYPNGYAQMRGTSMATPHVSGVLALMISHEMHVNNLGPHDSALRTTDQLITDLFSSTVKFRFYTAYVATGGRLNVMNALELTPGYGGTEPPDPPVDPDVLTVESSVPKDGAKNVSRSVLLRIDFDQSIDLLVPSSIGLDPTGSISSIKVDTANQDILLIQTNNLARRTNYTLSIPVGAITSQDGDPLGEAYTLSFKTKNK
jgi:subtilisin family serine protease